MKKVRLLGKYISGGTGDLQSANIRGKCFVIILHTLALDCGGCRSTWRKKNILDREKLKLIMISRSFTTYVNINIARCFQTIFYGC